MTIDLTTVSYNPSPTTTGCFKNTVELAYDATASAALARWMVGGKLFERRHKLISISATGKSMCGAGAELIRKYQFTYQVDADTGQSRLQSVQATGRAGTAEATTPITVATFNYGAATSGGQLNYVAAAQPALGFTALGTSASGTPVVPGGNGWLSGVTLTDVTGDGRPDNVFMSGTSLRVSRNKTAPGQAVFSPSTDLSDSVLDAHAIEARTMKEVRYSNVNTGTNDHRDRRRRARAERAPVQRSAPR